ncbi:MAG TPA: Gfo/Idh/MocA family oxidoreductase [Solirubrobacteraceae bacterium]|nr:Gfo/Idh/MocA family oxidoreductase [Solirubrobacteraceae bacterium]
MSTAPPLRWGILGTGHIARAFCADLALTDSGSAVAVGSRRQATADAFAAELGLARAHGSYGALLEDPDIDVIYVATPHPFHRGNAIAALESGKPVLVEKPLAMNAAEARDIATLAQARGLFAMEAMWTRFLPHVQRIREWIAAGAIGEIVAVMADHGQSFTPDPGHRLFAPELGGGALLDLGVYPVSFASMLLGPPQRVVALLDPAFTGVDAQTSMLLGYAGGAQAILTCTLAAQGPTRAVIVGTMGRIETGPRFYAPTDVTLIPREGEPVHVPSRHTGSGLRHQADEVARCLAAGETESPLMPLEETVSIAATMDTVLARGVAPAMGPAPGWRRGGPTPGRAGSDQASVTWRLSKATYPE